MKESNAMTISNDNKWPKIKTFVMAAIFVSLAVFAWIMFALPTIIYHIPQDVNTNSEQASGSPPLPPVVGNITNCSEGFYLNTDTGLCGPLCGEWTEFSASTVVTYDAITTCLYVLHILGTVLACSLSFYRYKYMLKFPAILLVYYLITPIFFDILHLIGFAGRDSLFCQSRDLLETIDNPTAFCKLTGVVNNFTFTVIDLFWLFHTLMVFWKVWFPIHARSFEKSGNYKYVHIAILAFSLLVSWIPVGVAFGTGGYTIATFPPFNNCFQRNPDATLYSFILPKCIIFSIGITAILLVIWKLVNSDRLQPYQRKGWCTCINFTAEVKLIIVFLYFTFAVTISLTLFIAASRKIPEYQQGFGSYFFCEAFGFNPDNPCVFELDRRGDQIFTIISYAMFVLAPFVSLIYILHVEGIKSKLRAFKEKRSSSSANHGQISSSSNL